MHMFWSGTNDEQNFYDFPYDRSKKKIYIWVRYRSSYVWYGFIQRFEFRMVNAMFGMQFLDIEW